MIAARNCFIKNVTGVLTLSNKNIEPVATGFGFRTYSKEKGTCCKDVVQTEGRQAESWPKPELYHSFRSACPKEQQPVNYDPYRIKVPEVAVSPFPPSNAKEIPIEDSRYIKFEADLKDLFNSSQIVHPDYWKDVREKKIGSVKDSPKLGYHGRTKYKYAFHEPWKPLDRMCLLELAEKEESEGIDMVNTGKQT